MSLINPDKWGVSLSLKQCRSFNIDSEECLNFLLQGGFRRFRLMSYWDEHEAQQGKYDFSALDKQFELIENQKASVTLCLGARQPRWPESHWPAWTTALTKSDRDEALLSYIQIVVNRYKNRPSLLSYQLENEFLNRSFGENGDFNRQRVKIEFALIKKLDPARPIIMSTSNSFGLPIRKPRPDIFGFSLYTTQYKNNGYNTTKVPRWFWKLRARLITLLTRRPTFIHELQAEPWGPKAIWEMNVLEQNESMSNKRLKENLVVAKATHKDPIDLWGAEWWYWRLKKLNDPTPWRTVQKEISRHH